MYARVCVLKSRRHLIMSNGFHSDMGHRLKKQIWVAHYCALEDMEQSRDFLYNYDFKLHW